MLNFLFLYGPFVSRVSPLIDATSYGIPTFSISNRPSRRPPFDPGRIQQSPMEDPYLPSSVVLPAVIAPSVLSRSCYSSRPDPESSAKDGIFQTAYHGKYLIDNNSPCPDGSSPPSTKHLMSKAATTSCTMLMYYQNVGGINSSLSEYQLAFSDGCFDVYALTETWLTANTISNQLFNDSYSVYRQDRSCMNSNKSSGGGVLLAVRSSYKSRLVSPPEGALVEQVWVAIATADAIYFTYVKFTSLLIE